MPDPLVQTRVPVDVARALASMAERNSEKPAALVRRILVAEVRRALTPCWIEPETACDPSIVLKRSAAPNFLLSLLQELPGGETAFVLLQPNGRPVSPEFWMGTHYFSTLDRHRFVLAGSHLPWRIVHTRADSTTRSIRLVLRAEERKILDVRKVREFDDGTALVEVLYSDGEKRVGKVRRQAGAISYPVGGTSFQRGDGWPLVPVEMVSDAMNRAIPG